MTVGELRDRVIADGIAEVMDVYEEDDPRRAGAIEGFELCRGLSSPEDYERVLRARGRREHRMQLHLNGRRVVDDLRAEGIEMPEPIVCTLDDYWRHRYGTLQVEWVMKCLLVVWGAPSVSGRALMKVMGVLGEGAG